MSPIVWWSVKKTLELNKVPPLALLQEDAGNEQCFTFAAWQLTLTNVPNTLLGLWGPKVGPSDAMHLGVPWVGPRALFGQESGLEVDWHLVYAAMTMYVWLRCTGRREPL